jgi:MFS family permease
MKSRFNPFRRFKYFYGWNIVGVAFVASFAHSAQISSLLGVFMKSMERDLGFTRTAISGVQTLARIIEAFLAPFLGPLVDRGWGKRLMIGGALIAGLAYIMLSQVQSLWQLYLIKGLIAGVGLAGFGQLVVLVAVSNWFVAKRGRALGITAMGGSVGSLTMIPLLTFLIAATSWRWGWGFLGIMIWSTVLLPAIFLMVRRPEDIGLEPDGRTPGADGADVPLSVQSEETVSSHGMRGMRGNTRKGNEDVLWSRRDVLMTRTFWLLTFTLGLSHMAMQAINLHLIPYIEDIGHATTLAAMAITARSTMSLVGSPLWGFAAERWEPRYLVSFKFLMYATGILVLMNATSAVAIFSAVLIYGMGMAGTNVMVEVMWANYYGRFALGMVRGMGMPFMTGVSAVGPLIAGIIYDSTNSYNVAFIAIIACSVVSAVLILFCTYPKRPVAPPQLPSQVA